MPRSQTIRCSVNSCHYWKSGNQCDANEIMITADSMASQAPDGLDAPMASTMPGTPVQHCMETCCKTFTPKGSGKENVDGVIRLG